MNETNTQAPEATTEVPAQQTTVLVADQPTDAGGPEKVKRSDINNLFQLLGYAEVTTWTEARLAKKIRTVESILEKDPAFTAYRDKLPESTRELYEKLKKMVATEDAAIDIVDDVNAKPAKASKPAKPAKAAKVKTPKASKKVGTPPARDPSVKRDAFGCSVGSRGYDAMALFVKRGKDAEPLKVKEIVDQSGHGDDEFVGVFYNFLNGMTTKGLLIKTDKGYRMSAAGWKVVNKATADEVATPVAEQPVEAPQEVAAPAA